MLEEYVLKGQAERRGRSHGTIDLIIKSPEKLNQRKLAEAATIAKQAGACETQPGTWRLKKRR
jgi:hypothetical protein